MRILIILSILFLSTPSFSAAEQEVSTDIYNQQIINSSNDYLENQQINQDEGYGPDDAEYYNAEGTNSEDLES